MRHQLTNEERGRGIHRAATERRAESEYRIAELEHLVSCGVNPEAAAILAGWPSLPAAARTLYRRGHRLATPIEAVRRNPSKKAA